MPAPGPWQAKVWDRPQSGVRYCAARLNSEVYGQLETAADARGGVLTFATKREAQRYAEKLNRDSGK